MSAQPPPRGVLFVSYDGVLGGPGRSQTIPYLHSYRQEGWSVHLLSFEKPELMKDIARRDEILSELNARDIAWTVLPYRRKMLGDLLAGMDAVKRIVDTQRPDVLHARSYVPALLCQWAGRKHGARLLFDMRGLWPDEKVDGGLWSRSHPLYLLWKRLEKRLLRQADGVVVLSQAGADLLREENLVPVETPLEVIPCCADLERFRPTDDPPPELRPFAGKKVYTFLGATGTWYLLDPMLDFGARAVRDDPDARLLFLTEDPGGAVAAGLASRGVPVDRFFLGRVAHAEVPRWIGASRAGVFFIRSCRSKKASCPTKLAEFLACGVPVLINEGIGDTAAIVREARVGAVIEGFGEAFYTRGLSALESLHRDPELRSRCRGAAECRFDTRREGLRFPRLAARLGSK